MAIDMFRVWFYCLHRLRVTPERACDIFVACVVCHKIAPIRAEQPAIQMNDPDEDHPIHHAHVQDGRAV